MPFLGEADVRVGKAGSFSLCNDLDYISDCGMLFSIPAGFNTDFASVPRTPLLRAIFPVNDDHILPSILHDYLYSRRGRVKFEFGGKRYISNFKRKKCDLLFLEAMESHGVSWWKRNSMYIGVRIAGWTKY